MGKKIGAQPLPEVGYWYHVNARLMPGVNFRMFCLCIQVFETECSTHAYVCYREHDAIVRNCFDCEALKKTVWIVTNSFHEFILAKLRQILASHPSLNELEDNVLFQLCLDFATQFRVYRPKDELKAIDRTYDVIDKMREDASLTQGMKDRLCKCHQLLLDEFSESKNRWQSLR